MILIDLMVVTKLKNTIVNYRRKAKKLVNKLEFSELKLCVKRNESDVNLETEA